MWTIIRTRRKDTYEEIVEISVTVLPLEDNAYCERADVLARLRVLENA